MISRSVVAAFVAGAGIVAAGVAGPTFGSVAVAAINADSETASLPSGHCLVASLRVGFPMLVSRSGRFRLYLAPGELEIAEDVKIGPVSRAADTTWWRTAPRPWPRASMLCMRPGGNLVLERGDASVFWTSHTADRARGGYATLGDGGSLVIRAKNGVPVWSTRTTATVLTVGDRLDSGQTLVNRTVPGEVTRLTMRPTGDLGLYRGTRRVWHTGTHVPRSYLIIGPRGRLKVVSPTGATQWQSAGLGSSTYMRLAQSGRITVQNDDHPRGCFVLPHGANPDCGIG